MPEQDIKRPGFPIRRILLDLSSPKAAHGFAWARVGDQFMLEIGYFDLKEMSEAIVARQKKIEKGEDVAEADGIDMFITDRFVMDIASTERLLGIMKTLQ